jgi:hypothetical protein
MNEVQTLCLIVVALTLFVLFGGLYLLHGFKFKD